MKFPRLLSSSELFFVIKWAQLNALSCGEEIGGVREGLIHLRKIFPPIDLSVSS